MAGKYPFPDDIRDPDRTDPNPFAGDDPALDNASHEAIKGDPAFAASPSATEYKPIYQAVLRDRAGMTMIIGAVGLAASLSGWLSFTSWDWLGGLVLMPLLSLAGSLPALLLSRSDLRAMYSGAMRTARFRWSALSCFLGAAGLASSLLYFAFRMWMAWMDY